MPFKEKVNYSPYLFVSSKDGEYRTVFNEPLARLDFSDMWKAKEYVKQYKNVDNHTVYGLTDFQYLYIFDNFKGKIEYDINLIKTASLDIETKFTDRFPDIRLADQEITLITLRLNKRNAVFGCGDYVSNDPNTFYTKGRDEQDMLQLFLEVWESEAWHPDIVTGWNITNFDIPYIVNRIRRLFDEKEASRLSTWGDIQEKIVEFRGKENQTYEIAGVAILDYYELYRKFKAGNEESYKLDYIAMINLGRQKLDYSQFGNIKGLTSGEFRVNISEEVTKGTIRHRAKLRTAIMDKIQK